MTYDLRTPRLRLIPLTLEQLRLCQTDLPQLECDLGLPISRDTITDPVRRAFQKKIDKMIPVEPEKHPWYTYWLIVTPDPSFGAGFAGFKGVPVEGRVEIGYGIDPVCQGKGYMTEAARALTAWAFRDPACEVVWAPILKSNPASSRVMEKAGARLVEETEDILHWHVERENYDLIPCRSIFGNQVLLPKDRLYFRPSSYGVILHEGKLLVLGNRSTGKYSFPGGGVEVHERLEDGLCRELCEEVGIEVEIGRLFHFVEDFFYYDPLDEGFHSLCFFYLCRPLTFDLLPDDQVDDGESEKPRWIDVGSLSPDDFQNINADVFRQVLAERVTG